MRSSLSGLKPYRTPKVQGLGLQSNTNRLGAHPVHGRLGELLTSVALNDYPDNELSALKEALAALYDLPPECFLITNGSNEAYDLIYKTFVNPGEAVAYPDPSFSMYPYYAHINGITPIEVPLDEDFDLDVKATLDTDAALIVLCSPNNPTGNVLEKTRIETVLKSGRPLAVDEAYGEFADQDWVKRIDEFPNLMVTRTFSKAYGLAGIRLGYLVAQPEKIEWLLRVRLPYNVNTLSQAVATAALGERGFVQKYLSMIAQQRPAWSTALEQRGFWVWPSQANFVLANVPEGVDRDDFIEDLMRCGVIVRSSGAHPRLRRCVRVTIGTPKDLETFTQALDEVLS